jgi:hypothetical protein
MKILITEEQNLRLSIVRRLDELWDLIRDVYPWHYPCDYNNFHYFLIALRAEMFLSAILPWLKTEDEGYLWDIIVKKYGDKIKEHYEGWCKDNKETIKEHTIPLSIKRRSNVDILGHYITAGELNHPMLCDDFDYPHQYVDSVIDYAVDQMLYELDDDIEDKDYYNDVLDYLRKRCRELFEDELTEGYVLTCITNRQ